jgi:hypothetical protein
MPAVSELRRSTACWAAPSSTATIPKRLSARCSSASLIIRSTVFTSCCRGICRRRTLLHSPAPPQRPSSRRRARRSKVPIGSSPSRRSLADAYYGRATLPTAWMLSRARIAARQPAPRRIHRVPMNSRVVELDLVNGNVVTAAFGRHWRRRPCHGFRAGATVYRLGSGIVTVFDTRRGGLDKLGQAVFAPYAHVVGVRAACTNERRHRWNMQRRRGSCARCRCHRGPLPERSVPSFG